MAGLNGLLAVLAGAAGAHGPSGGDSSIVSPILLGSFWHLSHAMAIFGAGMLVQKGNAENGRIARMSALSFQIGIIAFAGTLYWLGIFGPGSLGLFSALTPGGGFLLIFGWILLSVASWRIVWRENR